MKDYVLGVCKCCFLLINKSVKKIVKNVEDIEREIMPRLHVI